MMQMPNTQPDFRALCAELLADYEQCHYRSELRDRARAALAAEQRPAPKGSVPYLVFWLLEEAVQAANSDAPVAAGHLEFAAHLISKFFEDDQP